MLFFIILFSLWHGTVTGNAVFVLDEGVTAEQIAVIASLAEPGTETKMLSEVSLDLGGYIVFSHLDDASNTAVIKQKESNIFVSGNVQDAITVMREQDYKSLLEKYGEITVVDGKIVEQQPATDVSVEQQPVPEIEAMTPVSFMEQYASWDDAVVVIGEKAPTGQLIAAVHLAGKYGSKVVKDSSVQDITSMHAISLGPALLNSVSAAAIEQGARASGSFYVYENEETGSAILVVAGETSQETRKAVRSLLAN